MEGYYRFPTIHKDKIAFVSEDDLWTVSLKNNEAKRLTNLKGAVYYPHFSNDGKYISYTGAEEGVYEIYIIPSTGGEFQRLTYLSAISYVVGWDQKGRIIFRSNNNSFNRRFNELYTVDPKTKKIEKLSYGMANHITFEDKGKGTVLGRNTGDPARWKRYRGGTAGELLIDKEGNFNFVRLLDLKTNVTNPMWIGNRIYFISDHENTGNIYSCNKNGKDIQKHTTHKEYYVRNANTSCKENIVYQNGGDLYVLSVKTNKVQKLNIKYNSPRVYIERKFVSASSYLEDFHPSFDAKKIVFSSRGKVFGMENFEGPVYQFGNRTDKRYRLAKFLHKNKEIVLITDEEDDERIAIFKYGQGKKKKILKNIDIGRVIRYKVSPKDNKIALINHRQELLLIDIEKAEKVLIFNDKFAAISDLDWSPDGKYITYNAGISTRKTAIFIYSLAKNKNFQVTQPIYYDGNPVFSKDGKYVFFSSIREFQPVMDSAQFEISFPKSDKIYGICLANDTIPFTEYAPKVEKKEKKDDKKKEKKDEKVKVKIHFKDIEKRVFELPIPLGVYGKLECNKSHLFILSYPVIEGMDEDEALQANIISFSFKSKKLLPFYGKSNYFYLADEYIFIRVGNSIKKFSASHSPLHETDKDDKGSKTNININRAKILVEPLNEWKQMYGEAWRLQRDNFWNEKMSGIDWKNVYNRYFKLIPRLGSRAEFSDLIWEMQGELGTSHCYEFGGDYHRPPHYYIGMLGADFKWDNENKGYKITDIFQGDTWNNVYRSPLQTPGIDIENGDIIKKINGSTVNKNISLNEMLLNKAHEVVKLTIYDRSKKKQRDVFVKTVSSHSNIKYREWSEKNRRYVHEQTNGEIGYIHIPDMGLFGYSEFHRYYLGEIERKGLVIDVRFNGGGFVSQLILEKLSRKIIGYDFRRWGQPEPYPSDAVAGPIVIITNEHAGSDGDIFSHSSKIMKLGKLIGKRTWGGVIGIWPRHFLSDGTITTQPEFSFWFKDVGWNVENYGTDPDIEVDIMPKDYKKGKDTQLDRAIKEIKKDLIKRKDMKIKYPDFKKRK